jgi:ATP-dependent DNA helicase RecG
LRKFDLIENKKLTNAAVILFCKNEQKQFIQSELKLARFRGLDKSEFIDNKAIRGNAFDLYEQAMLFLRNYLPIAGKIEEGNPFRVDTPAIPYNVLREALVNALCHRDYSFSGGSISLAIYDDRVEVSNTGRLPNNISVSDLTKPHDSHPRNPLIADVFYACAMIERWGRGTQQMVELCRKAGNPKPKFVELTGSFTVILPLKEPIASMVSSRSKELTPRQEEILALLKKSQLNSAQIAKQLKSTQSRRMVQIDLTKLEKNGLIKREGESRSIVWKLAK